MIRKTLTTMKGTAAFFMAIVNSFNPLYYTNALQKPLAQIAAQLLYFLLVTVLLTAAVILPMLADAKETLLVGSVKVSMNSTFLPSAYEASVGLGPLGELSITGGAKVPQAILLLTLPGLLMLHYIFLLVKYFAVILATTLAAYAAAKAAKRANTVFGVFKTASYAATALIIMDFAALLLNSSPIKIPAILPLAAYGTIVALAIMLNQQGQNQ